MEKAYTESEIKKAFWETFHKSGEIFFDYLGTDEENEDSTKEGFNEFMENLNKKED